MEIPDIESPRDRLNNFVAISVALLSVFMAVTKVKDDNICQAMLQAKSDAVDTWNEYQAKRLKHHLMETARDQADALSMAVAPEAAARLKEQIQRDDVQIQKYESEEPTIAAKAKEFEQTYDSLNYRDDQFDLSDAALSVALGLMAVTALTRKHWLLYFSWVVAALGVFMGLAGLVGLHTHPAWLIKLLS
jgi:hypothetical protein